MASEAVGMAERAPKTLQKATRTIDEAAKMVEVGYGTIAAMDQAFNEVHKVPSEASDDHSKNVEESPCCLEGRASFQ